VAEGRFVAGGRVAPATERKGNAMDQVVRVIVGVALFGGTGAVVLIALPKIVVWCLEIIDVSHVSRSRKKTLLAPQGDTPGSVAQPPEPLQEN
jgi:hypothetical protein